MTSRFIYVIPILWALSVFAQDPSLPGAIPLLLVGLFYLIYTKPNEAKPKVPASERPSLWQAHMDRIKRRTQLMEKREHTPSPAERLKKLSRKLTVAMGAVIALGIESYASFSIALLPLAFIVTPLTFCAYILAGYRFKK